jgi:hypothetical protein
MCEQAGAALAASGGEGATDSRRLAEAINSRRSGSHLLLNIVLAGAGRGGSPLCPRAVLVWWGAIERVEGSRGGVWCGCGGTTYYVRRILPASRVWMYGVWGAYMTLSSLCTTCHLGQCVYMCMSVI